MKILNLALAIAAPAMLSVAFVPNDNLPNTYYNNLYINNITIPFGSFKLNTQPYYNQLFTKKELKKLAKAEKLCSKTDKLLLDKSTLDTDADNLEKTGDKSAKTLKKVAKLRAKSANTELSALKTFETASATFKDIYTQELNTKLTDTLSARTKAANNLAQQAKTLYAQAATDKRTLNTDNALQVYRKIYSNLDKAIECQELAFAIISNDNQVDYTQYVYPVKANPDPSPDGNVAKEDLPILRALQHYDFNADKNIYHIRYYEFKDSLKISAADTLAISKLFAAEKTAAQTMAKAQNYGLRADTMRVYASEAVTLTEREYYEQLAQENELNECSSLVSTINQEVKVNNALLDLYNKYIATIRKDIPAAKAYEAQSNDLYSISKTYETAAAKQYSKVEQYTILSEGNQIKLQAIENIENAIALYLGKQTSTNKNLIADEASARHNDIAVGFVPNEADEQSNDNLTSQTTSKGKQQKNTVVETDAQKPANQLSNKNDTAQNTTPKNNTAVNNKPKTNTNTASKNNQPAKNNKNTTNTTTTAKTKVPVSNSTASAVSSWFYTKEDQRLKPYTYPSGTIFTVETGIYKEMPEPVEFPAINIFVADKLKNQDYMRYYLGSYRSYDAALAAQTMAKNGGYKSAVVTAFVNGKKTAVATAKAAAEKQSGYNSIVQSELKELSIHQNEFVPTVENNQNENNQAVVQTSVGNTDAQPLSNISGTAYAVQIASVPSLLSKSSFNVNQLYYDQNNGGLYRYYTGVSTDLNIAKANLQTMKACGYDDAYIIKLVNGKNSGAVSQTTQSTTTNKVTIYRVQIGAYKSALSKEVKNKIENLKKSYPVHTSKSGEYTVYTVGDCSTRSQADNLRADLVKRGYTESYVVSFINGVKQ